MFRYANRSYNLMWAGRRVAINYAPDWARKPLLARAMALQANPTLARLGGLAFQWMIPGYLLLKRRMDRYAKWL